jgi:hypothetical protein
MSVLIFSFQISFITFPITSIWKIHEYMNTNVIASSIAQYYKCFSFVTIIRELLWSVVVVCDYWSYIVRQDTLILIQIADHALPTPLLFNIYWMDGSINCSESEACSSHQISCSVLRPAGHPLEQSSYEPLAAQRRSSHLQFSSKRIASHSHIYQTSKIKSGKLQSNHQIHKLIRLVYVCWEPTF